jgi:hypothetical protein
MNPSGSQGTQCVHQDFLRIVDTDKYQQSASMCVYRATQDGSWGLTFVIYFNHGIQVLSRWCNSRTICCSLVWLFQCTKYLGYSTLIDKKLPPDGSNDASWSFFRLPRSSIHEKTSSGARPALPMGVAPEAIVEKTYFEYRLKYIVPTFSHQIKALYDNIVGCALSAPDSSSPRGYSRIFLGIDSKSDMFFLNSSVSFISIFRRLPWSSSIRRSVIPYFCWIFPYQRPSLVIF